MSGIEFRAPAFALLILAVPAVFALIAVAVMVFYRLDNRQMVVIQSEFIKLRDKFGHQRLREGVYTPGQIDTQWTEAIKTDFLKWLEANHTVRAIIQSPPNAYVRRGTNVESVLLVVDKGKWPAGPAVRCQNVIGPRKPGVPPGPGPGGAGA